MKNPEGILEKNLDLISKIVKKICYRSAMQQADVEDALSYTYERFVNNDYKIIRKFDGETLSQSFLVLVVTNICKDYFRQQSSRWRSSTKARELGEPACRLEELLYRHQHSFEEAVGIIEAEYRNFNQQAPSRADMEEIVSQLKVRQKNVTFMPGDPHLSNIASSTPDYESAFRGNELRRRKTGLDRVIAQYKSQLGEEEKLIFKLYFDDNHSISSISRVLNKSRYYLKKSIAHNLEAFKHSILTNGFKLSDVEEILEYFH